MLFVNYFLSFSVYSVWSLCIRCVVIDNSVYATVFDDMAVWDVKSQICRILKNSFGLNQKTIEMGETEYDQIEWT